MSIKLNGSLYIDEDLKLIYRDPMYKIFVDDHCTKYEIYDGGNAITGYIRLFILNKTTEYINIINDIFIEFSDGQQLENVSAYSLLLTQKSLEQCSWYFIDENYY